MQNRAEDLAKRRERYRRKQEARGRIVRPLAPESRDPNRTKIKDMTDAERRAYLREAQRRHRAKLPKADATAAS